MEFYRRRLHPLRSGQPVLRSDGRCGSPTRQEFIDRHVFYDGRYIGTELLTAELEDYAPAAADDPEERAAFLAEYFAASGW